MKTAPRLLAAVAAIALAAPAFASPFTDAEVQLREAYGAYRSALFLSNAGKAPETTAALGKFQAAWQGMAVQWGANPPPQYAEDAMLNETFAKVDALIGTAEEKVAAGALPEAHEVLEGIRGEIQGLHERNGLIGYSDRMNAYHAAMEKVLAADYAALPDPIAQARADAVLLDYLAGQIVAFPAPEAAAPDYAALVSGFTQSVADFKTGAESGDLAAALKARDGLKVPYSKLFLKFG